MKVSLKKGIALLIILVMVVVSITIGSRKYKDEVGGYDLYTLLSVQLEVESIVREFDDQALTDDTLIGHYDDLHTYARYAQLSPILGYLSADISYLDNYDLRDLEDGRIEDFRNVNESLSSVIDQIHNSDKEKLGIIAYDYLVDDEVVEDLNDAFGFIWHHEE